MRTFLEVQHRDFDSWVGVLGILTVGVESLMGILGLERDVREFKEGFSFPLGCHRGRLVVLLGKMGFRDL